MKFLLLLTPLLFSYSLHARSVKVQFAQDVPQEQVSLFQKDLQILPTLKVEDPDGEAHSLFEIPTSGDAYSAWLAERVKYVVAEGFPFNSETIHVGGAASYYKNPTPVREEGYASPRNFKTIVNMSNLSSALFLTGKESGTQVAFINIPGIGRVKAPSVRVGITKVGAGLFLPVDRSKQGKNTSYASSLYRLSIMMHEARHSDGNGRSVGFKHAVCPKGHDFEGYTSCDRNLNGPYTLGAVFLKSVLANCESCSEKEKENLRLRALDSLGRVIHTTPYADAIKTNVDLSQTQTCMALKAQYPDQPGVCDTWELRTNITEDIPSTLWDARPESVK